MCTSYSYLLIHVHVCIHIPNVFFLQDLLLKLLSRTLDVINDEEWTLRLGTCVGRHYELYAGNHDCKVDLGVWRMVWGV